MNTECPRCATSEQTVNVPHALNDPAHPLPAPEAGQLLPPPPPPPATVRRSTPAVVLYVAAGVFTALWLLNTANVPGPEEADAGYRLGALLGPLLLVVPLALAGLVVQLTTRPGRVRAAERGAGAQHALWEQHHRVWRAAWLCRRCRAVFFPQGALGPDSPASPALEAAQLPGWVVTAAAQAPTPAVMAPTGPGAAG
ncbi:hypothetical protein [Kitasatospora sp. NPDC088134]|uniref:hypothetical protein n=1 Tax=Kitasatospora sp. NPDC088134 TaxID=3364071 RepID=UPI0037FE2F65